MGSFSPSGPIQGCSDQYELESCFDHGCGQMPRGITEESERVWQR